MSPARKLQRAAAAVRRRKRDRARRIATAEHEAEQEGLLTALQSLYLGPPTKGQWRAMVCVTDEAARNATLMRG